MLELHKHYRITTYGKDYNTIKNPCQCRAFGICENKKSRAHPRLFAIFSYLLFHAITAEMAIDIRQQMKATKCVVACRRMEVVALRGESKNNKDISAIKGYSASYVSELVSGFIKFGMDYVSRRSQLRQNIRTLKILGFKGIRPIVKAYRAHEYISDTMIPLAQDQALYHS